MVSSIANSLGFGSGIDTKQLVTDLSNASRDPKIKHMATLTQANQTRISALAKARSDLDGFADSLSQMVSDGTLRSTPTVSDESVLGATSRAVCPPTVLPPRWWSTSLPGRKQIIRASSPTAPPRSARVR